MKIFLHHHFEKIEKLHDNDADNMTINPQLKIDKLKYDLIQKQIYQINNSWPYFRIFDKDNTFAHHVCIYFTHGSIKKATSVE